MHKNNCRSSTSLLPTFLPLFPALLWPPLALPHSYIFVFNFLHLLTVEVTVFYNVRSHRAWKSKGVTVKISTLSIGTQEGCRALLNQANAVGPVRGIFNVAVALYDAMLENQTENNFVGSFEPKATATKFLDELSREMCPYLR